MKRLLCVLVLCVAGCGQPQYPPYKQPQLSVEKSMFGAKATVSSDASGRLGKMTFNPQTGEITIEGVELTTAASPVLKEFGPLMAAYAVQQQQYAEIRRTEWQGVNQALATVAPTVAQIVGGQQILSGMKIMRPKVVEEAIGAIALGSVDGPALLRALPPDISAEVAARLRGAAAAASQPVN